MKNLLNILVLAAVAAAAVSCAYERKSFPVQDADAVASEFSVLSLVPMDAPAAFCLNACAQGLEQVYAKAPFDSLDFGEFAVCKAVLSFFYDGKLMPCLYIDAAAALPADDPEWEALCARLQEQGILFRMLEKDSRSVLFLTTSDYALANQEFSMASGKSILDAPGFAEALASAPVAQRVTMFLNNKEAAKLPRKVLAGDVSRNKLTGFLPAVASWTVIADESENLYDIAALTGEDASDYMDIFSSVKPEECRIGEILPKQTTFLLDLPISSWKTLHRNYESWLKARSRKAVNAAADPIAWAKMVNPKEIAYMHFNKFRVLAVRAGSRFKAHEPAVNPYPGAVPALLGNAFQLNDDSCFAVSGKWIIIGSEEAVNFFLKTSPKEPLPVFCGKPINFGIYKPGEALWDEGGLIRFQYAR